MSSSASETRAGRVATVRVTARDLVVSLTDGRTMTVPLRWFPRLAYGSVAQRRSWRLIGRRASIHWVELDEDISVDDLLAGRRSRESKASLRRWLGERRAAAKTRRSASPPARKRPTRD